MSHASTSLWVSSMVSVAVWRSSCVPALVASHSIPRTLGCFVLNGAWLRQACLLVVTIRHCRVEVAWATWMSAR